MPLIEAQHRQPRDKPLSVINSEADLPSQRGAQAVPVKLGCAATQRALKVATGSASRAIVPVSLYGETLQQAGISATPHIEGHNTSAWAQYTIRVQNRETVQAKLKEHGIPTAVHAPIPFSQQPAVADEAASLPAGDEAAKHVISLPMHPAISVLEKNQVIDTLQHATKGSISIK